MPKRTLRKSKKGKKKVTIKKRSVASILKKVARIKKKKKSFKNSIGVGVSRVTKAPVSQAYKLRNAGPMINRGQDFVVKHCEFLQDLVVPANSTVMSTILYPINFGLQNSFPWAGQLGALFEYYSVEVLGWEYLPVVPTSAAGDVSMVIDYDARDTIFSSYEQFMAYKGATSDSIWKRQTMSFGRRAEAKRRYYTRTGAQPSNTDIREYDVGNFQIRVDNVASVNANVTVGKLLARYSVTFYEPRAPQTAGSQAYIDIAQSAINTNPMGVAGVAYNNPLWMYGGSWSVNDPVNPMVNPFNGTQIPGVGFTLDPGTWFVTYNAYNGDVGTAWTNGGTSTSGIQLPTNAALIDYGFSQNNAVGGENYTYYWIIETIVRQIVNFSFTAGTKAFANFKFGIAPALQSFLSSVLGSELIDSQELSEEYLRKSPIGKVYRKRPQKLSLSLSDNMESLLRRLEFLERERKNDEKEEIRELYVHVPREVARVSTPKTSSKTSSRSSSQPQTKSS